MAMIVPAWEWKNGAWTKTSRGEGEQVYLYPFATGWRWAYVNARYAGDYTGWLAMRSSDLNIVWSVS
jgi:hypothetical protein